MDSAEWTGIWVIAEQIAGHLNPVSFELLSKARALQQQLGSDEPITAVLLGNGVDELADDLGAFGAEEVIVVDNPALKLFENESYALVLSDLIEEQKPAIVLMGATTIGQDLASILGVELNTGVAAHCIDLRIDSNRNLVSVVPAFGGKVLGDILCPNHRPQVATIKPGILGKPVRLAANTLKVIKYDPSGTLQRVTGRLKALGIHKDEQTGVPLQEAEVVVAGGWGIGSKENWGLLEDLALLLGGSVGCTRPAVDEGWVEGEHQMIGTSGITVRPKVYLGFAVSGSTHHICGMKDSELVVSVNIDAAAPIFEVSDIRIIANAKDILEKLIDQLRGITNSRLNAVGK